MLPRPKGYTLAFVVTAALLATPSRSQAHPDTAEDSVVGVEADLNECSGNVPSCSTIQTPVIKVGAGQAHRIKVMCPEGAFFWNWTAEASRQLVISLRSERAPAAQVVPSDRPVLDAQNRPIGAIFKLDEQTGARAGRARISIGCSPQDPTDNIVTRRSSFSINPRFIR